MDTKTTEELDHEIEAAANVDDFLNANRSHLLQQSLSEHLSMLLEQKGLSRADVARRSLLERKYAYQIFSGQKTPSRDKLLALAFGFGLSVGETQKMLKLSGKRELYSRDSRDALILFTLQRTGTIFEVNDALYCHGLETLGVTSGKEG